MGLFNDLFGNNKKQNAPTFGLFSFVEDQSNKDNKLEEEMNRYGLDEWQKELVREGKYNPWDFEEDDSLDEDDYYSEDESNE